MGSSLSLLRKLTLIVLAALSPVYTYSQQLKEKTGFSPISTEVFSSSSSHWYNIHDDGNIINPVKNQPRYRENEITEIADNILIYQRTNGGWPKNYDMQAILNHEQIDSLVKTKNIFNTTFDNSTTFSHIDYLARVYSVTHIAKYKESCLKGIYFTLSAQYQNGGWPQYFPLENNYSRKITFNDGAFVGIMKMFKGIIDKNPVYSFISSDLRKKVKYAFDKGLDCILLSQIKDNGKLTAWCQQHDEIDLKPAWARAYEPPSICNGESADIVLLLMSIDNPDERIIRSVQSAVKWFNDSKIFNMRVEIVPAPPDTSQWRTTTYDRVVVIDSLAPPIWARYYELGTDRPLFSDRSSKIFYSLAEVSRERRSGYNWYIYSPQEVLDKYPAWYKKWGPRKEKA